METIQSYLENMFSGYPQTRELLQMKREILSNMVDKYNELKMEGRTENEAIGMVIADFGNIDELVEALGVCPSRRNECPVVELEEAQNYLAARIKSSKRIALGVVLCILGAAALILFSTSGLTVWSMLGSFKLSDDGASIVGLVILLVMVAIAVLLFIYANAKMRPYLYLQDDFVLAPSAQRYAVEQQNAFRGLQTLMIAVGVVICILSPLPILLVAALPELNAYEGYSVVLFLTIAAIAVFLFILAGVRGDSYKILLQQEAYSPAEKKQDKFIEAVAAVVWPLATCVYLLWSFISGSWEISWVVWPVVGVLFGGFCSIYKVVAPKKETH
ncbi:MAG: hypothetical protein DBY25_05400 [Clostridiales bacterium]|nr:MAG: hypothetical protein DBY25_05400 [Clostridiales bacterium]